MAEGFGRWESDLLFPAAECVQDSADRYGLRSPCFFLDLLAAWRRSPTLGWQWLPREIRGHLGKKSLPVLYWTNSGAKKSVCVVSSVCLNCLGIIISDLISTSSLNSDLASY
jgi:hypothetical protein